MTPPSSTPEHDFEALVSEKGCQARIEGSHGKIYRNGDILITYAVAHKSGGKREVKFKYIRNFLKRLEEVEEDEKTSQIEETKVIEDQNRKEKESYKEMEWFKQNQMYESKPENEGHDYEERD